LKRLRAVVVVGTVFSSSLPWIFRDEGKQANSPALMLSPQNPKATAPPITATDGIASSQIITEGPSLAVYCFREARTQTDLRLHI